mgnify:FL=1
MIALGMVFAMNSCKCTSDNSDKNETAAVAEPAELVVENLVSTDRQTMYLKYGDNYRWFETTVVLNDFLDSDTELAIAGVVNIFQGITEYEGGKSFDTEVVTFTHTPGENTVEAVHDFWLEDSPLNDEAIVLTFTQALERVLATNSPKPHSRYAVLRKQVGPKDANPQYVFGNVKAQLYVDSVTGAVSDSNPVFAVKGFKMPLGEWP